MKIYIMSYIDRGDDKEEVPTPGGDRVGNDPNAGERDSSFGSNLQPAGNETRH